MQADSVRQAQIVRARLRRMGNRHTAGSRRAAFPKRGEAAMIAASSSPVRVAMTTPHDLKTIGLKATLPRLKILDLFEHSEVRHLTAEDVYKLLLKEGMDIGLATIYRVLTQFEQAGLLIRHHF